MHQSSGLRTIFFGTPEFASYILEQLLEQGERIVAVVTTPAKPKGRGLKVQPSAVQLVAEQHGIPVLAPRKLKDPVFAEQLRAIAADCFCVVAYKILPVTIFTLPAKGSFNIHASLLPKYRGAAPINWAIIQGETVTGITTFFLEEKVDTGLMLLQRAVPIGPEETAGELHDQLKVVGAELAHETLLGIAHGTLVPTKQSEGIATAAPKIFAQDCVIDFRRSAAKVHNFIRGLSPYPGATTLVGGSRLKILQARIAQEAIGELPAGAYRMYDNGRRLFVGTLDAPIELLRIQREGKSVLLTEDFLRGAKGIFQA